MPKPLEVLQCLENGWSPNISKNSSKIGWYFGEKMTGNILIFSTSMYHGLLKIKNLQTLKSQQSANLLYFTNLRKNAILKTNMFVLGMINNSTFATRHLKSILSFG